MKLLNDLNKIDFYWSDIGDFIIENGDIKDTRRTVGAGFLDEAIRRIKSSTGDWKLNPTDGASLSEHEGKINGPATWQEIKNSIIYAYTHDLFLYPDSFEVNIAPIDIDEIAIRIDFSQELSILLDTELPVIKMVYNLQTHQPFIMR